MSTIFETLMLVCFGAAWPASIYKSWTSRTNRGKSIFYLFIILTGYIAGIGFKLTGRMDGVIFLYIFNMILVSTDITIFFRNAKLDKVED